MQGWRTLFKCKQPVFLWRQSTFGNDALPASEVFTSTGEQGGRTAGFDLGALTLESFNDLRVGKDLM